MLKLESKITFHLQEKKSANKSSRKTNGTLQNQKQESNSTDHFMKGPKKDGKIRSKRLILTKLALRQLYKRKECILRGP